MVTRFKGNQEKQKKSLPSEQWLALESVEHIEEENAEKSRDIKVMQADMLELPFDDECFDLVIEKGTMDVLFVDSGDPWNPKPETMSKVMSTLKGVHRVLKEDGIFISITFGQPHFRRPIFNAPDFTWSVEWTTFGETFHYFVYVLKKYSCFERIRSRESKDS
ncbi:hypothetical protein KIW84_042878 [Lathyrus oleraceus]|uniref:Methyltransferase domain-containing protein n=2 Tax=Pisum sativum TaxID=3888 RepID=A0A9D4XCA7_PEA|nr:hypothetical protein KIW84_042878 [Pisum sativum]